MKYLLLFILITFCQISFSKNTNPIENKFPIDSNFINLLSNYPLNENNGHIKTLIIPLHGTLRNGSEYFQDMINSLEGKLEDILIVAPTFKREDDQRDENELYWGKRWYQKWKYGYLAQNSNTVGSFDVMDLIIEGISNSSFFPNLDRVILIGHSAGGQFTQRYAVASEIQTKIKPVVNFVVSNPSSYLYLDSKRIKFEEDFIAFSPNKNECEDYNEYIYGLENELPEYFKNKTKEKLKDNFKTNHVIFLMSEEDKETDDLDQSCGANLQGKNRIDRAINYFQYIRGNLENHHHQFISIPSIGHDHLAVFKSPQAQSIFFNKKKNTNLIINHIGNLEDIETVPSQSFILMGGGKNETNGFKKLLIQANGGDIVILSTKSEINHRYTHYLWKLAEENNIKINSITTLSTKNRDGAEITKSLDILNRAEAIYLTGGDQFRYRDYWINTEFLNLINLKIQSNVTIAGSSAGLAIMGQYYFSAENGTISSEQALITPESSKIIIEKDLLNISRLKSTITDTHFSERNREGRLISFMHKIMKSKEPEIIGIGVDENSSLIINKNNLETTGAGNIFIYKFSSNQKSPLNFGPLKKFTISPGTIFSSFSNISNKYDLINVIDGKIQVE